MKRSFYVRHSVVGTIVQMIMLVRIIDSATSCIKLDANLEMGDSLSLPSESEKCDNPETPCHFLLYNNTSDSCMENKNCGRHLLAGCETAGLCETKDTIDGLSCFNLTNNKVDETEFLCCCDKADCQDLNVINSSLYELLPNYSAQNIINSPAFAVLRSIKSMTTKKLIEQYNETVLLTTNNFKKYGSATSNARKLNNLTFSSFNTSQVENVTYAGSSEAVKNGTNGCNTRENMTQKMNVTNSAGDKKSDHTGGELMGKPIKKIAYQAEKCNGVVGITLIIIGPHFILLPILSLLFIEAQHCRIFN